MARLAWFVVDEPSWQDLLGSGADVEDVLLRWLERLAVASDRDEEAAWTGDYQLAPRPGLELYEWLFAQPEGAPALCRDLRLRLATALERLLEWPLGDTVALDVVIGGASRYAPSLAFAHARGVAGEPWGCLPLPLPGGPSGPREVAVGGVGRTVHFVTDDGTHRELFRAVIEEIRPDAAELVRLCPHAFPDLCWADDLWPGLEHFSRPFSERRAKVAHHLSVLNDDGARLFAEGLGRGGSFIERELGAHGADASPESPERRRDPVVLGRITRRFAGRDLVCEWHTKLQPNIDRIHFHPGCPESGHRVVVGLFIDHA